MNISDVREDDGGVYSCALWKGDESVGFYSFFKEIHLHVTGERTGVTAFMLLELLGLRVLSLK